MAMAALLATQPALDVPRPAQQLRLVELEGGRYPTGGQYFGMQHFLTQDFVNIATLLTKKKLSDSPPDNQITGAG
jgi:hypothetical protein